MFGNPETTTGGNALKFYASMRIDIRRTGAALKDKEGNVTGNHVKVKVVKNKLAPPFRVAEFDIMYGEGISKNGEIVDLGVDHDIIQKSGAWYSYNGAKIAQGRDAAKQFLDDNPEVALEIELKIKEKITSGASSKRIATADVDDSSDNGAE
jgi:recombination protein RecA